MVVVSAPIVLISPAMAVSSRYYRPLVEAFADRGWTARALPRRGFEPDEPVASRKVDWSYADEISDIAEAVAQARAEDPDRPVLLLGHSLGAQLVAGHDLQHEPSDGFIAVGAAVPHFRRYPRGGLPVLAISTIVPVATRVYGYLPKPAFGSPGARTLMREWARFARTGRPPFPVPGPLPTPTLVVKLQGDSYAVSAATDAFASTFLDEGSLTRWTYLRSDAPEGGTTHHVQWVRTPDPVVDRIVAWWDDVRPR